MEHNGAHGSAISLSVSLMIRFGKAIADVFIFLCRRGQKGYCFDNFVAGVSSSDRQSRSEWRQ